MFCTLTDNLGVIANSANVSYDLNDRREIFLHTKLDCNSCVHSRVSDDRTLPCLLSYALPRCVHLLKEQDRRGRRKTDSYAWGVFGIQSNFCVCFIRFAYKDIQKIHISAEGGVRSVRLFRESFIFVVNQATRLSPIQG